ncbi:hypothetical protein AAW12_09140 [Sphingobacterium sp. Ag1]|nr:hypothetical protein AAW12_09140 [Sphingobacterium sp. Ag1]
MLGAFPLSRPLLYPALLFLSAAIFPTAQFSGLSGTDSIRGAAQAFGRSSAGIVPADVPDPFGLHLCARPCLSVAPVRVVFN